MMLHPSLIDTIFQDVPDCTKFLNIRSFNTPDDNLSIQFKNSTTRKIKNDRKTTFQMHIELYE